MLVLTTVIVVTGGQAEIRVAAVLGGGSGLVSAAVLAPLLVCSMLAYGLESRNRPQERAAERRTWLWDQGLLIGTLASGAAGFAVAHAAGVPDAARGFRNLVIMCGVATVAVTSWNVLAATGCVTVLLVFTLAFSPYLRGANYVRLFQAEVSVPWGNAVAVGLSLTALAALRWEHRLRVLRH